MATSPAPSPVLSARLRDRRFYLFITILSAALVFAGFAHTFFLNSFCAKLQLPSLWVVHGVAFSGWIVILLTQSVLVSTKQIRLHKKLGYASLRSSRSWLIAVTKCRVRPRSAASRPRADLRQPRTSRSGF